LLTGNFGFGENDAYFDPHQIENHLMNVLSGYRIVINPVGVFLIKSESIDSRFQISNRVICATEDAFDTGEHGCLLNADGLAAARLQRANVPHTVTAA